jgi:hypothetical protein
MRRRLLAVPAIVAGLLVTMAPAKAAIDRPVAVWPMNEPAGSRTMMDTSGNMLHGTIGTDVRAGTLSSDGSIGYRFPFVMPDQPPANPKRLVQVPNNTALNPGSHDFAIEFRMRTTHSFGNIVQKGQSGSAGGYFKFEQPDGKVTCLFRGSAGDSAASSGKVRVNDGLWHVVRCERTSSGVTMKVDGVVTGRNRKPSGTIANTKPLTIAGKLNCDQVKVGCDYFSGNLDYVKIETS